MKIVKVTSEECLNIANHQKKVIDRLSRKIQKLKQQTTKHDVKEVINLIKFKDKYINQQLQQRIDKTIDYIVSHSLYGYVYDNEELFEITSDKQAKKDLLEILKGSDN